MGPRDRAGLEGFFLLALAGGSVTSRAAGTDWYTLLRSRHATGFETVSAARKSGAEDPVRRVFRPARCRF